MRRVMYFMREAYTGLLMSIIYVGDAGSHLNYDVFTV